MKKILLIMIAAVISVTAFSQYQNIGSPYGNNMQALNVQKAFYLPRMATPSLNGKLDTAGAMVYITTDSSLYYWTGYNWIKAGSGGGGGSSYLASLLDVDTTGEQPGYVLNYNGTNYSFTPQGVSNDTSFTWSVLDSIDAPTAPATTGDIYLVSTNPTGVYTGEANNIATYNGSTWDFSVPTVGDLLYNATTDFVSQWTGTAWVRIGRATLHQGGDSYGSIILFGSRNNKTAGIKTNNTRRTYWDKDGGVTWWDFATGDNAFMGLDASGHQQAWNKDSLIATIGGAQTWQQTLTTGSTLTTDNTVTNTSHTLTFNGGNYNFSADDTMRITATNKATIASLDSAKFISTNVNYIGSTENNFTAISKSWNGYTTTISDSVGNEFKVGSYRMLGVPNRGLGSVTDSIAVITQGGNVYKVSPSLASLWTVYSPAPNRTYLVPYDYASGDTVIVGNPAAWGSAIFTVNGTSQLYGNVSIGTGTPNTTNTLNGSTSTSTSSYVGISMSLSSTATSATEQKAVFGAAAVTTTSPSSSANAAWIGVHGYANMTSASGTPYQLIGVRGEAAINSATSGSPIWMKGVSARIQLGNANGAGAIPKQTAAIFAEPLYDNNTNADSVRNYYAIYIDSSDVVKVSSGRVWGIHSGFNNNNNWINGLTMFGGPDSLATHTVTLSALSTGIASYNTLDKLTNYERVREYWSGNTYNITSEKGGTGTLRPIKLTASSVQLGSVVNLQAYTVATLPAGTVGDVAYVTDALGPTYLSIVVGGGTSKVPVFYNGTNWVAY